MKDILYSLVYFPMPFIWFMLLIIIVGSREKIFFFFKLIFIFFLISSLPLLNTILEYPLKNNSNTYSTKENISFVLVPTAGIYSDSLNNWYGSKETIIRTIKGYKTAESFGVPLIISGGKTINNAPAESFVAKKYLLSEGLIILDHKSKNSFQTAHNLKNILKTNKLGNGIIALATSPIHNLRMNLVLRTKGFVVTNIRNDIPKKNIISQFIPHVNSFARINGSLYEYLAIIKYIVLGYIDFKIIFS